MSFVYFIASPASGAVKIGRSANPWKRLAEIQVGNADDLQIVHVVRGGADSESAFHLRFADHHIRGEWFDLYPVMEALVAEIPPTEQQVDSARKAELARAELRAVRA